jgi:hypothetical protein
MARRAARDRPEGSRREREASPAAAALMEPRHPGTIEFVDGATGATVEVVPAESVDPALRWLPGPDGELRPVVRVEITTDGDRRTIRELGPDGELLRSSLQRRN